MTANPKALIWDGASAWAHGRAIDSLDPDDVEEIRERAAEEAKNICAARASGGHSEAFPCTQKELANFQTTFEQELLCDAVMERLSDEGRVVFEYSWDGAGENTSAASSFFACVKEWEGFYGLFSDVTVEGPFLDQEEARAAFERHCG